MTAVNKKGSDRERWIFNFAEFFKYLNGFIAVFLQIKIRRVTILFGNVVMTRRFLNEKTFRFGLKKMLFGDHKDAPRK